MFENLTNVKFSGPADERRIKSAEMCLNLKFAEDFKDYVRKYGQVCSDTVNLTGITTDYGPKKDRFHNQ